MRPFVTFLVENLVVWITPWAQWGQAPMRPFAWEKAKGKAALAVNTELLEANWQTGRYIVEFEQQGNAKARYGEQLLTNLSRDLTKLRGKGYSRSNLGIVV